MTKLSVNINKIATLRNARGGAKPSVLQAAKDVQRFGADGVTIHPRPDERHITYKDTYEISEVITTEFNIEGNPQKGKFLEIVKELKPTQATLVPDTDDVLTSSAGWDTVKYNMYLTDVIGELKDLGIRTSVFLDPIEQFVEGAKEVGADRIELYTEAYAVNFHNHKEKAVLPYVKCAEYAQKLGLGINAGHDLDLDNLNYLKQQIPAMDEVSIGHALISDALYLGLENTIQMYQRKLSLEK